MSAARTRAWCSGPLAGDGSDRCGAGRFDHQLGAFEYQDERLGDRLFADRDHLVDKFGHMGERHYSGFGHGDTVGHRVHRRRLDGAALGQRIRPRSSGRRLHPDDPDGAVVQLDRGCDAGEQTATTQRHQHCSHIGHLFEHLDADGGLPGHDVRMIERVDQHGPRLVGESNCGIQTFVDRGTVHHDVCAVRPGGCHLRERRSRGHEDGRRDSQRARRPGDALGMIARTGRDHTPCPLLLVEPGDPQIRTPGFE